MHAITPAIDVDQFNRNGFAIVPDVVDSPDIRRILTALECMADLGGVRRRMGATFAVRGLFDAAPEARFVLDLAGVRAIAASVLGLGAFPVRAILFDKNAHANWAVAWHQDTTIAVEARCDAPGFGPWSVKAGVVHVRPPQHVLDRMATIRLHLDGCDESNGALDVIPGSHGLGLIHESDVESQVRRSQTVRCPVPAGGALVMRPLLLHASAPAALPRHRRVVHIEYARDPLPFGLEWATA